MNTIGRTYEEGKADGIRLAMNLVVKKMRTAHDALNKVKDMDELKAVRREISKWDRLYAELNKELGEVEMVDEPEEEEDEPTPKIMARIGKVKQEQEETT